jgi:hypothetical protein
MSKETDILEHSAINGFNVLLTGRHGVGKTAIVRECFNNLGWNWKYFSASTIDPWVDLVGVPKEKNGVLELIRPANLDFDNIEAIFLDEYNRAPKKVRNAVMELIQFKSINGKKFPKLKVVFAAINPDDDDEVSYDVEKLDPAQVDRFEIMLPIKNEPCPFFFKRAHGNAGALAVKWWLEQTKEIKDLISPRRLEAGVKVFVAKGDPGFVFDPEKVNVGEFAEYLDKPDPIELLDGMVDKTDAEKRKFLRESNTFKHVQKDLLGKERYLKSMAHCMPETEQMKQLRQTKGTKFITHVCQNVDRFKGLVEIVLSAGKKGTYSTRVLDAFSAYRKSSGLTSSPATLDRTVMVGGKETKVAQMTLCFSGKLSGYSRDEAQDLMECYGAEIVSTINFKTTHLVTGDRTGTKVDKAKKQNITIISENQFYKLVQELKDPSVTKTKSGTLRTIGGVDVDIDTLTLENYLTVVGSRFRMEKFDVDNGLSRQEAFEIMVEKLRTGELVK